MNRPRTVNLVLRMLLVSALIGGCATSPSSPPTPITSISQIEGKWRGTITLGFACPQEFLRSPFVIPTAASSRSTA